MACNRCIVIFDFNIDWNTSFSIFSYRVEALCNWIYFLFMMLQIFIDGKSSYKDM